MNFENIEEAKTELTRLRNIIRYHRDQKGADRCWLDDELLYESLPENIPATLPSKDIFMEKCSRFHANRQAPKNISTVDQDKSQLPNDDDIKNMNSEEIKKEIGKLHQAIRIHRNIGDKKRSWQDDRRLYNILNENTKYDTSLPDREIFLESCNKFFSTRVDNNKLH